MKSSVYTHCVTASNRCQSPELIYDQLTMRSFYLSLICLIVSCAVLGPAQAELYRWTDEQGVVHFSDQKTSNKAEGYTPETKLSTYSNTYALPKSKQDFSDLPPFDQRNEKPDIDKLYAVVFPETPTVTNIAAYIQKIYSISRNQKNHLAGDPQVSLLMQIGSEYLHVLIRETNSYVGWHNYGIEVIKKLAIDIHKPQILLALKTYSKYANVIYAKGWHHEFQNELIRGLQKNRGYVPSDWIRAVAEFDRNDAHDALIEYFKYGWNNHVTYQQIAGIDSLQKKLKQSTPTAWETASQSNPHAMGELTPRALELGYRPAFKFVMTSLKDAGGSPSYALDPYRLALRFTEQTGTATEIWTWYKNNQRNIKFDSSRTLFVDK